jgi:phosphoribosyl 1,2-cyclic phosphodiesterase
LTSETIQNKIKAAIKGAAGLDLSNADVLERYLDRLSPALSIPVGGNTSCIELQVDDQLLILDAGSGLRELGEKLIKRGYGDKPAQLDFLMTHTHWDHVQGFPFFELAFRPENRLTFYSAIPDLEARFSMLVDPDWSPGLVDRPTAQFKFVTISEDEPFQLGCLTITPIEMSHPGRSFGYRIEDSSSCLVYATDAAYDILEEKYVTFFKDADLLIFDTHFSFEESIDKVDWGHSTAMFGAEFAYRAQAKRLALFHHNPVDKDETIHLAMQQAQAYLTHRTFANGPCQVIIAKDGLELEI